MKELGKREAEFQYKNLVNEKLNEYKQSMKNIKDQYDHLIEQKEAQFKKFIDEANSYTVSKK